MPARLPTKSARRADQQSASLHWILGSVKVRGHIDCVPDDKAVDGKWLRNLTKIQIKAHRRRPFRCQHYYMLIYCFLVLGSVAGSSAMVLSTQALLVAVGVGTQSAAPMAAALNWVMKDGVGQLGGVLFASQLGKGGMDVDYWKNKAGKWLGPLTSKKGKKKRGNFQRGTADTNSKRWRMVAALALDLSTLLEICTPFLGAEYFLPCASIANVGKNIGFLAASASRAAIHQSLTKTEGKTSNLGDITAKAGSQAILASLLGTGFGILFSQTFCSDYGTAGILAGFVVLSAVHQTLHIALDSYMQANFDQIIRQSGTHKHDSLKAPLTPTEVAERESFLPLIPPDQSVRWLSVGASLVDICPSGVDELESLMIQEEREAEVNGVDQYENDDDLPKGMFYAYAAHECMRNEVFREDDTTTIAKHSYDITKSQMPQFMNQLEERGWQMERFVNVECGSSCRLKIQEVCSEQAPVAK
eukprot:scaffold6665_cov78-Skeletonema_dohrnii-CCMP3373.AAC.3